MFLLCRHTWGIRWMLRVYEPPLGRLQPYPGCPSSTECPAAKVTLRPSQLLPEILPRLATSVKPLNDLLHKDRKWVWTLTCTKAVETVKQLLTTSQVLVLYDTSLPIKLDADTSQYGLGAVISHMMPDGIEKPIAFASCTLSISERTICKLIRRPLPWYNMECKSSVW